MTTTVFDSVTLPGDLRLKNRLVKAAMEENLANEDRSPSLRMLNLYQRWSQGGVGLIITGNVMVDGQHMTGPGGLVLSSESQIPQFAQWAQAAKSGGSQVWMQINHPGRQAPVKLNHYSLGPSAVALELGNFSMLFAPVRAMSEAEIHRVIGQFAETARLAHEAGFDGVEIHGAHGYLISQFLSPLVNKRDDQWGGSLENRARLLVEIVNAIRAAVPKDFALAVKINSADFQRGGFAPEDALKVVKMLELLGVSLVELSGGSYEAPAMQGKSRDERTLSREAYFLQFAQEIAEQTNLPVMTTGGIRRLPVANEVVQQGVTLVGIATALALVPDLPNRWRQQDDPEPALAPLNWQNKTLASLASQAQVRQMIRKNANRQGYAKQAPYWLALAKDQWLDRLNTSAYKRWSNRVRKPGGVKEA